MRKLSSLLLVFFMSAPLASFSQFDTAAMINDLAPANFKADFSQYDQETSMFCAQLSEMAYWNDKRLVRAVGQLRQNWPDHNIRFKTINEPKSGTQVLLYGTKDFAVVAFRGTEFSRIKDIISDGKFTVSKNLPETDEHYLHLPEGHSGFRRAIMNLIDHTAITDTLRSFIATLNANADSTFPVYMTGHSLGAALANMFIIPLQSAGFHFSGLYGFAPPLALVKTEYERLHQQFGNIVYDIVHHVDYVPRAGAYSRKKFKHVGKFYRICKDGIMDEEDERYIKFKLSDLHVIKYHRLAGYLSGVKGTVNTAEKISARKQAGTQCFPVNAPLE